MTIIMLCGDDHVINFNIELGHFKAVVFLGVHSNLWDAEPDLADGLEEDGVLQDLLPGFLIVAYLRNDSLCLQRTAFERAFIKLFRVDENAFLKSFCPLEKVRAHWYG